MTVQIQISPWALSGMSATEQPAVERSHTLILKMTFITEKVRNESNLIATNALKSRYLVSTSCFHIVSEKGTTKTCLVTSNVMHLSATASVNYCNVNSFGECRQRK
jgi:hypothetical protein